MKWDTVLVHRDFVGLEELKIKNEPIALGLRIYPNPISEHLVIGLNHHSLTDVIISNMLGEMVMQVNNFDTSQSLNVSGLQAGMYTLRLQNKGFSARRKFVKE